MYSGSNSSLSAVWKIVGLAFFALAVQVAAFAYPPEFVDGAKPEKARWKEAVINIAVSASISKASNIKGGGDPVAIIRRSLKAWEDVAQVEFIVSEVDKPSANVIGRLGDGISLITIAPTAENILFFSDNPNEIAARTRVFFDRKGFINEADIVLNPYQQFSADGSFGAFDLESTLTHELGHLLGLGHSELPGATMNASQSKNGVYNIAHSFSRTLAEDDIAGIRSIYGPRGGRAEDCCGSLKGKLESGLENSLDNSVAWLEEKETGRVASLINIAKGGNFRFDGLPAGKYGLYWQSRRLSASAESIGEVSIEAGKTLDLSPAIALAPRNFSIEYIGFNSQLSNLAVSLNKAKSYVVYIGGSFDPEDISISFNSPFLSFNPATLMKHDFGDDISAVSFEVNVDPQAAFGEYSIWIQNSKGGLDILPGALTIESSPNPWSSRLLPPSMPSWRF